MHRLSPTVTTHPSGAWRRAGLPERYEKLGHKGQPKADTLIGEGAYGHAFKAYDRLDHRFVVVKKSVGQDAAKIARAEWAMGEKLRHPQLVQTLDLGIHNAGADSKAYLITEYIPGTPVVDWGKHPRRAVYDVLCALRYLHSNGIAHRDIHASNVLQGLGHAWLIDLGHSCALKPDSPYPFRQDLGDLLTLVGDQLRLRGQSKQSGGIDFDEHLLADFEALVASPCVVMWLWHGDVPSMSHLHHSLASTFFSPLFEENKL